MSLEEGMEYEFATGNTLDALKKDMERLDNMGFSLKGHVFTSNAMERIGDLEKATSWFACLFVKAGEVK